MKCARGEHRNDRLRVDGEGCRESRRCSRDTYPQSYITKYTSIRRQKAVRDAGGAPAHMAIIPCDDSSHCWKKAFEVDGRYGLHHCEVCSKAGSYVRLIDFCITQRKAQGTYRTCNESEEEEEEEARLCLEMLEICESFQGRQEEVDAGG